MKYDEIIKLLDAGYTRDEILAMKAEPEPEPTPEPEPAPADDTGMSDLVKEMRDAFSEMRKEFTAMNIMASRQPAEKKPDEILANIINPTRTKKGDN